MDVKRVIILVYVKFFSLFVNSDLVTIALHALTPQMRLSFWLFLFLLALLHLKCGLLFAVILLCHEDFDQLAEIYFEVCIEALQFPLQLINCDHVLLKTLIRLPCQQ